MCLKYTKEHAEELAKWSGFTGTEWTWETLLAPRSFGDGIIIEQVTESYVVMVEDSDDENGNPLPYCVNVGNWYGVRRSEHVETKENLIPTIEYLKKECGRGIILKSKGGK